MVKGASGRDFYRSQSVCGNTQILVPLAILSGDKSGMLRKTLAVILVFGLFGQKILTYLPLYFIVKNVLRKWKVFR